MAVDHLELLLAHQLGSTLGNVLVGGAVEAVATDGVILVVLGGNGVAVSLGGHGHMEGGVEHGDLRRGGHHLLASLDAHQVGGVMQWSQGDALLDGNDHVVIDDAGVKELHAAMQNTMTDSVDFVSGLDHAQLGIHQDLQRGGNGLGVGGHGDVLHSLGAVHVVVQAAVNADTLAQALGGHHAGIGIHQLVLEGRGTGIDNQNVHGNLPPKIFIFLLGTL